MFSSFINEPEMCLLIYLIQPEEKMCIVILVVYAYVWLKLIKQFHIYQCIFSHTTFLTLMRLEYKINLIIKKKKKKCHEQMNKIK